MEPVIEYIQEVGALPLIKSFCDKLRLAELIDEILPLAPQALMGNGIVFVALLMNRLTAVVKYLPDENFRTFGSRGRGRGAGHRDAA